MNKFEAQDKAKLKSDFLGYFAIFLVLALLSAAMMFVTSAMWEEDHFTVWPLIVITAIMCFFTFCAFCLVGETGKKWSSYCVHDWGYWGTGRNFLICRKCGIEQRLDLQLNEFDPPEIPERYGITLTPEEQAQFDKLETEVEKRIFLTNAFNNRLDNPNQQEQ